MPLVKNRTSILIGQSGMGKSSLINLLVPGADIATREISTVLNSGKHTTTFTRLYRIDENTAVIDSPGFQEFGLYHLTEGMLERAFREFRPYLGHCRFYNCRHLTEPGCAILEAVKRDIFPERVTSYTGNWFMNRNKKFTESHLPKKPLKHNEGKRFFKIRENPL